MMARILAFLSVLWTAPALGGEVDFDEARSRMVDRTIRARGVKDAAVLDAMRAVPRHRFVPARLHDHAYADHPLAIGHDQTISQPYIVAWMTELLEVKKGDKVLEIGTGSGYQTAVLAAMGVEVYSIEIVEPLALRARKLLTDLGYEAHLRVGDGYQGWTEAAPFDGIIVTAAPEHVPQPLVDQLDEGARLVIPVGGSRQRMLRITRTAEGVKREDLAGVLFVPMTGEARGDP